LENFEMKKSLVALAALAATASFAQSTTTISGLFDYGWKNANAAGTQTQGIAANGSATTVLTFDIAEDLGGGNSAFVQLQLTPTLDNKGVQGEAFNNGTATSTTANGVIGTAQQAIMGMNFGTAGKLALGRANSGALDAWGVGSVFGTALGSGYSTNGNLYTRYSTATLMGPTNSAPTRFNGAIRYDTPVMNGFSASYLTVPKSADTNVQTVTDYAIKYSNGPLNVAYANQKIQTTGTVIAGNSYLPLAEASKLLDGQSNKLSALTANYTFGAVTVYGIRSQEKQDTSTPFEAVTAIYGAKYVMGQYDFLISNGKSNETTALNVDKSIQGYGVNYNASKRSTIYARYEIKNSNLNDTTGANTKTTTTMVGLKHTF